MPRKSGARMRRESCKAMAERKAPTNPPPPLQQGRSPRKNAALRRLQPHSGAAAFQGVIGESKEGPRRSRAARLVCGCFAAARNTGRVSAQCGAEKSQSPYPSLAAGGCHKAAPTSTSGARTLPLKPQSNARTQSNTHNPILCSKAVRNIRTRRSAASNPLAERRRFKG